MVGESTPAAPYADRKAQPRMSGTFNINGESAEELFDRIDMINRMSEGIFPTRQCYTMGACDESWIETDQRLPDPIGIFLSRQNLLQD